MPTKSFYELFEQIQEERYFHRLALNPLAQFGSETAAYLGAQLLPERLVAENAFEETQIRYKTRPALDNNRYSPTQMQAGGQLIGSFKVNLGHTDTQSQMDSKEYDDLLKMLGTSGDMQAIARIIRWADTQLMRPHVIKNEIQRWQALLLGSVERKTVDGTMENIEYYRPAENVIQVPAGFVAGEDPFDPIEAAVVKLEDLGYEATGLYSSKKLARIIRDNDKVKERQTYAVINDQGQVNTQQKRLTDAGLQRLMLSEEFPALTAYNNGYESVDGFKRFMDVEDGFHYMLVTGSTNRNYDMAIDYAGTSGLDVSGYTDGSIVLNNTLGYYAVGRNAGESSPGRSENMWMSEKKPKGIGGETYQTGLPVPMDPQSFVVIRVADV